MKLPPPVKSVATQPCKKYVFNYTMLQHS